jgi:hypothetical protein
MITLISAGVVDTYYIIIDNKKFLNYYIMIEEIELNGLDNKPIKTTKKPPPRSINENLPPYYFRSIFIGSKGSGKTFSLMKLSKYYEKYPIYENGGHKLDMRVIVFCPTILSTANPIYETLKYFNGSLLDNLFID